MEGEFQTKSTEGLNTAISHVVLLVLALLSTSHFNVQRLVCTTEVNAESS